nr:hypothetical protein [Limosilactobacillus mucosae]
MQNQKEKKAQIIAILNNKQVIINIGKRDGVKVDDKFDIVDSQVKILRDPDTHEILDRFHQFKQQISAIQVETKYSICSSIFNKKENSISKLAMRQYQPVINAAITTRKVGKHLNVDQSEVNDITAKYNYSVIHIGDKVTPSK